MHQDLAGAVGDAIDQVGRDAVAAVGEHRIGAGQLQGRDRAGAQRQRQHGGLARLVETEAGEVVLGVLRPDGLQDADGHHVLRLVQALAHGQHGLVLVAVVLRMPGLGAGLRRGQFERLVGDLGGRRQAALERGGIDERLDVRAGLAPCLRHAVEVAAVEVEAADHGADGAVLRRQRHERGLHRRHVDDFPVVVVFVDVDDRAALQAHLGLGLVRQRPRHHAQRLLVGDGDDFARAAHQLDLGGAGRQHDGGQQVAAVGELVEHAIEEFVQRLRVVLDAGRHVQLFLGAGVGRAPRVFEHAVAHRAIGRFLVLRLDGGVDVDAARIQVVLVHVVEQLARQFGDVFAMDGVAAGRRAFGRLDHDGLRHRFLVFGLGQVAQRIHAAQHIALAQFGARAVGNRVEARRRLGNAGQHGGLGRRDLRQRLAEIGARGGGEAVGAMAQVDLVHVQLEDLVLGELRFDLEGEQQFVELARIGLLGRQVEVARHLHGDGARALRLRHADQVGQAGADDAHPVDPAVLVETIVLGGQHRRLHDIGDFVEAQHVAALFAEFADQHPVGRIDAQRHARPIVGHGVQIGQVGPGQRQGHAGQQYAAQGQAAKEDAGLQEEPQNR
ncbi:Uncharacterised protein [Bordetella pertussis]|nr:Uncharacterised protein [Bordetella pertussis]CFV96020.1 Uncharacterised protein [Bordetella pertussis]